MASTTRAFFDQAELERLFHLIPEPGSVVEIRILDVPRVRTVSGYFDDSTAFVKACQRWSGKAPGIYLTLNPCKPALLARSQNHLKEYAKATTADGDIVQRRWLPIDFDPVRPAGISSTDVEHDAALSRAQVCRSWLAECGWPEPVFADSGNGGHLLYRVDLPADDDSRDLLQRVIQALALYFSDDTVALDQSVFNAARIWKAYGTLCCKGDDTPERPHRLARILEAPSQPVIVPPGLLSDLAVMIPEQPQAPRNTHPGGGMAFRLDAWIAEHGLSVLREGEWGNGGHKWLLNPCPWNGDHTDKAAYIVQFAGGAIAAGCHHNGCTGKGWADLRDMYEPDWRQQREAWDARQTQAVNGTARVARAAGSAGEAPEMWTTDEPPSPWVRSVDKREPFPTEVFPGPCRGLIESTATALPCPPDFVGVPMLAVLGAAMGNTRIVEVKPGWREGARLWAAVVAPPGNKKSPALARAVAPLHEILRLSMRDYKERKKTYEEEMLTYEKELAAWRKDKSPGRATPVKPEEPVAHQPIATDSTVEALGDILSRNPRGILFERDELTGWARAMNQYKGGKGADRQTWLSFWNGAIAAIGRRARKDPLVIENPLVNVAGCLPPDVLEELNDEHGREDGFVHRILFGMPEPVPLVWTDADTSQDVIEAYTAVVEKLYALTWQTETSEDRTPHVLTLTPKAYEMYTEWLAEHYAELASPALPDNLQGPWLKFEGYCIRLALVLQMTRWACEEAEEDAIDEVSMVGAVALITYFKSHAKLVYGQLQSTKGERRIDHVAGWIRRHGRQATPRDICTYKVGRCKTQQEAEGLLRTLVAEGYGILSEEAPAGGGHVHKIFRLHNNA